MYNIALIAVLFVIVPSVAEINPNGRRILQAVGVFWATVFSSSAFVVPRLLQVRKKYEAQRLNILQSPSAHADARMGCPDVAIMTTGNSAADQTTPQATEAQSLDGKINHEYQRGSCE